MSPEDLEARLTSLHRDAQRARHLAAIALSVALILPFVMYLFLASP